MSNITVYSSGFERELAALIASLPPLTTNRRDTPSCSGRQTLWYRELDAAFGISAVRTLGLTLSLVFGAFIGGRRGFWIALLLAVIASVASGSKAVVGGGDGIEQHDNNRPPFDAAAARARALQKRTMVPLSTLAPTTVAPQPCSIALYLSLNCQSQANERRWMIKSNQKIITQDGIRGTNDVYVC